MSELTPFNGELDPAEYDGLIDWPRRLDREAPLLRACFASVGAVRVLDAACGTGRHAAMFHEWGLDVTGADASAAMIAHCRAHRGESERLRWIEHSYHAPHHPGSYDALICVGNSLAIAEELGGVRSALCAMIASLRPGGIFVIQILNAWRIAEGPVTWEKFRRLQGGGANRWLLKGFHRVANRYYVEIVTLTPHEGELRGAFRSAAMLALNADDLLRMAGDAGGTNLEVFGDYEKRPYDRLGSQDIIAIGRRGTVK